MLDDSVFEKIRKRSEEFLKHSHHSKSHIERVYPKNTTTFLTSIFYMHI